MAFEIEQPIDAGPSPVIEPTKPRLLRGPGRVEVAEQSFRNDANCRSEKDLCA